MPLEQSARLSAIDFRQVRSIYKFADFSCYHLIASQDVLVATENRGVRTWQSIQTIEFATMDAKRSRDLMKQWSDPIEMKHKCSFTST